MEVLLQILIAVLVIVLIWKYTQKPYKKASAKEILDFMEKHRTFKIKDMPKYQANFTKIDRDEKIILNNETLKYNTQDDTVNFEMRNATLKLFAIEDDTLIGRVYVNGVPMPRVVKMQVDYD